MSYVWFQSVLEALGKRINFESVSNLYGKTVFDKKGGEAINKTILQANPLTKVSQKNSAAAFLSMPGNLTIIESGQKEKSNALGDTSWFDEFIKFE